MDAEPDKPLTGVVYKVGLLPDSENQQFNPDQKVYKTTVTINERFEWLKPGMTAQAEIVVKELDDVVYVPLQAVIPHKKARKKQRRRDTQRLCLAACFPLIRPDHSRNSLSMLPKAQ